MRWGQKKMTDILIQALEAYAITFVMASSEAGGKLYRRPVRSIVSKWLPTIYDDVEYFLKCRMCTGFWVSLAIVLFHDDISIFLPVYGLSYFICTQERT